MKEIPLTQGKTALIDDEDYEWLSQWKWHAVFYHRTWYAVRNVTLLQKRVIIKMHRLILGLEQGDPREGDHKDHDGLNNQRDNLRISTPSQNRHNQQLQKNNVSGYKGVQYKPNESKNKPWRACIAICRKFTHLGYFSTAEEAAQAYNNAAIQYFGEFAHLNVIEKGNGIS